MVAEGGEATAESMGSGAMGSYDGRRTNLPLQIMALLKPERHRAVKRMMMTTRMRKCLCRNTC